MREWQQRFQWVNMGEADFDRQMNIHYKGGYFLQAKVLALLEQPPCDWLSFRPGLRLSTRSTSHSNCPGDADKSPSQGPGPRGNVCNIVLSRSNQTDVNDAWIRNNPQMKSALANNTARGRAGQADDVGGVVACLDAMRRVGPTCNG
jgi:hypothetical protein